MWSSTVATTRRFGISRQCDVLEVTISTALSIAPEFPEQITS
jgi:hypothetical protein